MNVRQIVLDTETTGLDTADGHRIIEIGCVEMINRRLTGNNFHQYLNPDRAIDEGALAVHGISEEFLSNKPRFADVVSDLIRYLRGSELVIHNAEFDVGFMDYEFARIGAELGAVADHCEVLDSLKLARQLHPGQRNDLDSLCKRYLIDNQHRDLHGALLDAEILADVYLAMTGGQTTLLLDENRSGTGQVAQKAKRQRDEPLPVIRADRAEQEAHEKFLEVIDAASGGSCLWRQMEEGR